MTSLEDPDFKIQERFTAIDSTCGQASISTGVALKDTGRPVIQVSTPRGGGTSLNTVNGCPIDFYVDGSANGISGMDLSSSNMDITAETDRVKIKVCIIQHTARLHRFNNKHVHSYALIVALFNSKRILHLALMLLFDQVIRSDVTSWYKCHFRETFMRARRSLVF